MIMWLENCSCAMPQHANNNTVLYDKTSFKFKIMNISVISRAKKSTTETC